MSLALLLTLATLAAQDPFPAPGADPGGSVVDERGEKIPGAKVELLASADGRDPYANAIAAVLRKAPLPSTLSDKDGEFVLPLLPVQRTLGVAGEGELWLVASKPGFREWREPLPHGIAGWLGSRVVLRKLVEGDPLRAVPWPPFPLGRGNLVPLPVPEPPPLSRAGGDGPRATSRPAATRSVRVTVRTPDGAPLAGASLRLSNGCWPEGPAEPEARAETEGRILLAGVAAGAHEAIALAAGHLPARFMLPAGEVFGEVTVSLEPCAELRVLTKDRAGNAVPFAGFQPFQPGVTMGQPVFTDSLGRIVLRVPATLRALGLVSGDSGVIQFVAVSGDLTPVSVTAESHTLVVVETEPIARIERHGTNQRVGGELTLPAACSAFLARGLMRRPAGDLWIGPLDAAPIHLRGGDLPASQSGAFDIAVVDARVRRRIPLLFRAPDGAKLDWLIVTAKDGPTAGAAYGHAFNLAAREPDGSWSLLLRDDAEWVCTALAGKGLSAGLTVPRRPEAAPDRPLEVVLAAGGK